MNKLRRFFNQNRRKILLTVIIIVFLYGCLQLLNYFAKNKTNKTNNVVEVENILESKKEITSNKSVLSGQNVSSTVLKKQTDIIDEFIKYCNSKDINSAYNMISTGCKEAMFPTIQDFSNIYYSEVFNTSNKKYTIENWIGDIYKVTITDNIIATGKIDESKNKQDYITIVEENDEYKLNINSFIRKQDEKKETVQDDIKIIINNVYTYMDYEVYDVTVENNSKNRILLDNVENSDTIYLEDSNDVKYGFYNNEMDQSQFLIQSGFKTNLKIKFMNSYSSTRKIKNLVFSKVILNYNEYKKLDNTEEYSEYGVLKAKI